MGDKYMNCHIERPPLWKTVGTVFSVCLIGLFVCVYLLFSGIHTHEKQLEETERELHETQAQLQVTKQERALLQQKISILENLEYERGTLVPSAQDTQEIR